MIIGNHINISDFLIIIPAGIQIGHGIMDVFIHRIGILGGGELHIFLMVIIPIIGAIIIQVMHIIMDITISMDIIFMAGHVRT
jgi:hypothetical protein